MTTTNETKRAAKFDPTAKTLIAKHGAISAEKFATMTAWREVPGSERRDFWMNVAQSVADIRATLHESTHF